MSHNKKQEEIDKIFRLFDTNGNGFIVGMTQMSFLGTLGVSKQYFCCLYQVQTKHLPSIILQHVISVVVIMDRMMNKAFFCDVAIVVRCQGSERCAEGPRIVSHSDGQLLALNPPCLHKSMLNLESCPSVTVGCKKNTLSWLWSSFAKPYECV
jgi:hypothetical protein